MAKKVDEPWTKCRNPTDLDWTRAFAHDGRDPRSDTTNDDRVQHCVQFRSGIQCDDQLGNSSTQRHFDTTITSVLSDNSSVAPTCCGHPPEGKDESQTGKCSDDGRGPVKTLSGRLARKLQRSASLVNAGLSKQIQTVLDVATVDRCDFVEICCSHVPCLTEAMQRRGLSSFSLLMASDAWLSPPVVTHQNNSIRHAAVFDPDRFSTVFEYAAAVLNNGGHIYWEWPAKCIGWSSVEHREFRAQQKSCGRELFMTACDSCFFAKKKTICWNIIGGNFSHLILVSKSTWVYSVTNTCGNKHQKERENIDLQ